MRILLFSLLGLSFWTKNSTAQDTINLDPKIEYFSKKGDSYEELRRYKVFPKYSREIIKTSRDSLKIEHCYYFDNKRNTNNDTEYFRILNDSIVFTNNEKWNFKKQTDSVFIVSKKDSCFIEKGTASSVIPFIKNGDFVHFNNQNDTLLIEHFEKGKYIYTITPKTVIKDSVYMKVDKLPKFPSKYGDLQTYISKRLIFPAVHAESSIQGKVYIRTILTSKGKISNIKILRGVDPELDNEALKVISRLPEFEPARLNGKAVNVYFTIPVKFVLQ